MKLESISLDRLSGTDNLFQSEFWGRLKTGQGWTARPFSLKHNGSECGLLVLTRDIAPGCRTAYVPAGPDLPVPPEEQGPLLESLSRELAPELRGTLINIRYDLSWSSPYGETSVPENRVREIRMNFGTDSWNLRKTPTDIQAPDTVIVDLRPNEQTILSRMRRKTRYNIGLAFRNGVRIEQSIYPHVSNVDAGSAARFAPADRLRRLDPVGGLDRAGRLDPVRRFDPVGQLDRAGQFDRARQLDRAGHFDRSAIGSEASDADRALDDFYSLYRETARRNNIRLHNEGYFREVLSLGTRMRDGVSVRTLIARDNGRPLAAMILAISGTRATYLYGASATNGREKMPTYALQWYAMKVARERGCRTYDMFGIAPRADDTHPMFGLFRFKTGFGGDILHRRGCWDFPIDQRGYRMLREQELSSPSYHLS